MTQIAADSLQTRRFAEQSLVAYIAPLVEGRRVAVVGPLSVEIARRARALGAKSVVAIGGQGEGVALRPLNGGAIEALRSRVDCVIVPDAGVVPLARVLDEARRALGRDGLLVVAAPLAARGRPVDFHSLRAAVEDRFSVVKMVGCGSFSGFTLASLDVGEISDDVTLDTRLMPDEPTAPELYIALASDVRFSIDPLAIVQVPATIENAATVVVDEASTSKLAERLEDTEKALAVAIEERESAIERANAAASTIEALRDELNATRNDLRRSSQRIDSLERALEEGESCERELRFALERAEHDRDVARKELQRLRSAVKERDQATAEDIKRFERALSERGKECESLRAQLADRDSAVRELLFQLDALQNSESVQRIAALEARNAELAALHAAIGAEAARVAQQNDILRDRIARLESVLESRDAEVRQLEFQLQQSRAALSSAKTVDEERIHARYAEQLAEVKAEFEAKLSSARAEVESIARRVRAEVEAEHTLAQVEQAARAARAREEADEEAAKLRSELEAQRRRANEAELALKSTLERLASVEAAESDARARAASAETRLEEAQRTLAVQQSSIVALGSLEEELRATKAQAASLEGALEEERDRHAALAKQVAELRSQLDDSLRANDDLQEQLANVRAELSRQLALGASIEDRATQLELELEGTKKGFTHRVRELEYEVEQLVRALEVATSSAGEEAEAISRVLRELDASRAERSGLAMRLADAEAALAALTEAGYATQSRATTAEPAATGSLLDSDRAPAPADHRAEQLLATLAETAARLASTEESLHETTAQLRAAQSRVASLEQELRLAQQRAEAAEVAASKPNETESSARSPDIEALERELSEREMLVRSLVAQLEDRDLRLRALERRLVEEVERARRTESEIWELELRARDQRIAAMQREIERAQSEQSKIALSHEAALRAELTAKDDEVQKAQRSLERVRSTLSAILVDGRGAGVSHELVALLRELDEPTAT
jgi:chromosome segregation ATPase